MENGESLDEIKSRVYQKVGRNLHLFQAIEGMLKSLVAVARLEGSIGQFKDTIDAQKSGVQMLTMGTLVGSLNKLLSSFPADSNPPENLTDVWMSFSLNLEPTDGKGSDVAFEGLAVTVSERNNLAHHFFSELGADSVEDWIKAEIYLDEQRDKVAPSFEYLKNLALTYKQATEAMAQFLRSEDGLKLFGLDQET